METLTKTNGKAKHPAEEVKNAEKALMERQKHIEELKAQLEAEAMEAAKIEAELAQKLAAEAKAKALEAERLEEERISAVELMKENERAAAEKRDAERIAHGYDTETLMKPKVIVVNQDTYSQTEEWPVAGEVNPEKEEVVEDLSFMGKVKSWAFAHLPSLQVGLLFVLFAALVTGFKFYESKIAAHNAELSAVEQIGERINAFNDANLQRIVFERIIQVTDLAFIILVLMITLPSVLSYILPLTGSKKDFNHEFFEALTPWQRTLTVLILISALLIYFGLGHSVNSI